MTYERFDRWIKRNKFFSAILITLFITGVIFQATDTFTRVKAMVSGGDETLEAVHGNAYKILNFDDRATFAFTDDAIEENVLVDIGVATLLIDHEEPVIDNKPAGQTLLNSDNEIWLVNLELSDAVPTEINFVPVNSDTLYSLGSNSAFTISFYAKDLSGLGQSLINLHFPIIDTRFQWSDYEHIPLSAISGIARHRAFFRLTKFKQKGGIGTDFKAEYIVPDADRARESLSLLSKLKAE